MVGDGCDKPTQRALPEREIGNPRDFMSQRFSQSLFIDFTVLIAYLGNGDTKSNKLFIAYMDLLIRISPNMLIRDCSIINYQLPLQQL